MTMTITSKGQMTLPIEIRRKLGLKTGDKLDLYLREDGRVEMIPLSKSIQSLKGILSKPKRRLSLEEIEQSLPNKIV